MKTLVLVSHPTLENSYSQQFLKRAVTEEKDVVWHVLDQVRPYDVATEQALSADADRVIFQFPFYWYSAPASLKEWEDTVLTRRFAYPDHGGALAGKELGLVLTLGLPAENYGVGQKERFSIDQLTTPFQALAAKLQMTFLPQFIVARFSDLSETQKQLLFTRYRRYLTQASLGHLQADLQWTTERLTSLKRRLTKQQSAQLQLILEQLNEGQAQLDALKTTLTMIRDSEDQ